MAIDAGTAFVTILPNTAKFGPALTGEVTKATSVAEKRTQAFAKAAAVGLGLAAVAAVKFGADSVAAYRESQEVLAQLQNTISHTPGYTDAATAAFQKQATALQSLTGFEDEQVLSADNALIRFKLTQDQVSSLIPVILDYARATGTDAVSAAENIGKALLGNTRALKTIGIEYHATGDRATDLANIQDLLKQKVGGAAEAFGQTSQGKIEIFRAKLNDLQEVIGKALLPVLDAVVSGLTAIVGVFQSLPGPVQKAVTIITALGIAFVGLGLALKVVRSALSGYTGQAAAATTATEAMAAAEGTAAIATTGWAAALASAGTILPVVGAGVLGMSIALSNASKEADKQFAALHRDIDAVHQFGAGTEAGTAAQHAFSDQMRTTFGRLAGFNAEAQKYRNAMAAARGPTIAASQSVGAFEHSIKGATDAMGSAVGEAARLRAVLASLHDKTIHVDTYYDVHYIGGGGTKRGAHGGAFIPRFAGGTTFLGPQGSFIAGEAHYPTPLGTGAEIASAAGVLPLNEAMIGRLGRAIAEAGGSSRGASAQEIAAALWPLMRELASRPVVAQIAGGPRAMALAIDDYRARID